MTKCTNCKTGIEGVSYTFNDETFCGKSCLVRYLLEEEIVYLKITKKENPVPEGK